MTTVDRRGPQRALRRAIAPVRASAILGSLEDHQPGAQRSSFSLLACRIVLPTVERHVTSELAQVGAVSRMSPGTSPKMRSLDTSGMAGRMAVAEIHPVRVVLALMQRVSDPLASIRSCA